MVIITNQCSKGEDHKLNDTEAQHDAFILGLTWTVCEKWTGSVFMFQLLIWKENLNWLSEERVADVSLTSKPHVKARRQALKAAEGAETSAELLESPPNSFIETQPQTVVIRQVHNISREQKNWIGKLEQCFCTLWRHDTCCDVITSQRWMFSPWRL